MGLDEFRSGLEALVLPHSVSTAGQACLSTKQHAILLEIIAHDMHLNQRGVSTPNLSLLLLSVNSQHLKDNLTSTPKKKNELLLSFK